MKTGVTRYLARFSKHRARLCSILSPGEIAIYQAFGEKRVNAWIARLKGEIEKLDALRAEYEQLRHEVEKRKFALRTLANHERTKLSSSLLNNYCRPETLRNGRTHVGWPTFYFLGSVTRNVVDYLKFTGERVRPPRPKWKAFKLLDKRLPSLQLAAQVDELAKRALHRLREDRSLARDATPLMWWLALIGHPSARQLMEFDRVAQGVVKKLKQRITEEKAQAQREAAARRQRARRQRGVAGFV
jgi:hypothetical protein